jgi:hypothetical protein
MRAVDVLAAAPRGAAGDRERRRTSTAAGWGSGIGASGGVDDEIRTAGYAISSLPPLFEVNDEILASRRIGASLTPVDRTTTE